VTERSGRIRLLGRMRVVHQMGAPSAQVAYGVLAKRASQLMLEAWQLDVDYSNDSVVVVEREGVRTVIEVSECWEVECLAGQPPTGLPGADNNDDGARRAV
jgi:hypothetical protein